MAISKEQWEARFKAALELRGMDLKDFPEELEGFPKRAAVRALHPSDTYLATRPLARSVAEELDLPEEWFTAEDFSEVFTGLGELPDAVAAQQDQIRELTGGQALLLSELEKVQRALRESQETLRRVDQNVQALGND